MKHSKYLLWLIVSAINIVALQGKLKQNEFKFQFEQIPFNKSISYVKGLVGDANMEEVYDPILDPTRLYEGLIKYFEGEDINNLNRNVVQKYEIKYWGNISEVELFFWKGDSANSNLFIVRKAFSPQRINYIELFDAMKQKIIQDTGVEPEQYESKYFQESRDRLSGVFYNAMVGIWHIYEQKIILLSNEGFYWSGIELLYIDNSGWNEYVKACKIYEQREKLKEEEKKKAMKKALIDEW